MQRFFERLIAFLSELQRRKVYRVVLLYCIGAYAVLELSDIVFPVLGAPDRALALVLAVVVAGLPIAALLGWMYDVTQAGVRRDPKDRRPEPYSSMGRAVRVVALLAVSGLLGWASWSLADDSTEAEPGPAASELDAPGNDPRRIAVLYFDAHGEAEELRYLAAGLTESLSHELATVPGLEVTSRSDVKPFRDNPVSVDSIARTLGVGTLVEGSVMQEGNTIRTTVQLIDGRTGGHLDSRVVEGSADEIFAFQDALADSVARGLRRHLGREIRIRGARAATESQEAWTLYQRGNGLLDAYESDKRLGAEEGRYTLMRADSLLAAAITADPDWVEPKVARVAVATQLASLGGPQPGALDTVWARRALRRGERVLDEHPESAAAYELRGWTWLRLAGTPGAGSARMFLDSAFADVERAVEIAPERAGPWWIMSETLLHQGRFAEAVEAANRAFDADVFLDVEASTLHALFYATLQPGPTDDAIRWCDEGLRRFPDGPNFLRCRLLIMGTFPQVEPDVDRAWELFRQLLDAVPDREEEDWRLFGGAHVAQVLAREGLADSARAVLRAVRGEVTPPRLATHEAKVHLLLGDEEEALRLLRLSLTYDSDTSYLARDWWFEELHDNPGFRELVGLGPG